MVVLEDDDVKEERVVLKGVKDLAAQDLVRDPRGSG